MNQNSLRYSKFIYSLRQLFINIVQLQILKYKKLEKILKPLETPFEVDVPQSFIIVGFPEQQKIFSPAFP